MDNARVFLPKYIARFHEHLRNMLVMMIVKFLFWRSCLTVSKYCGLPICVDFTTAQLESNLYNIRFVHKMTR